MTVKRLFNDRHWFPDASGNNALSGGKLFVYLAGTSTKATTYNSSAGSTPNSNPLVLDSAGKLQSEVWVTTGATYKLFLGLSTETDPPTGTNLCNEDNITAIGDFSGASVTTEWIASGLTPTYVSGTSFTLVGDQTAIFKAGLALKVTDGGGTKYGFVKTSVFGALTTVTLDQNSSALASPTTAVSYGIISPTNTSAPILKASMPLRADSTDQSKQFALNLANVPTGTTVTQATGAGGILPAGIGPLPYSGSSIPTGWLACDGSAISRTTYAALFTAISTTWGTGDGSTTFNLPDMRGRIAICDGTGTVAESVTDANVSVGGDTFTVASNATKWVTGQSVILTTTTTLPTGLALATPFFVIRISATTIKFATSLANAQNGTAIDITAVFGSGTHTLTGTLTARTLGQVGGEEAHAISSTEDLAHTHGAGSYTLQGTTVGGTTNPLTNNGNNAANFNQAITGISGSTGGNAAMNIMQPFIVTKYIISY